MKKKLSEKTKRSAAKKSSSVEKNAPPVSAPVSVPSSEPRGIMTIGPNGENILLPHPDDLLREAEQEPNYQDLDEYVTVIDTLRQKGFSFREIAEWLSERGVEADHNAVYRIYTKNMTRGQALVEEHRAEEEAEKEAMRERD